MKEAIPLSSVPVGLLAGVTSFNILHQFLLVAKPPGSVLKALEGLLLREVSS